MTQRDRWAEWILARRFGSADAAAVQAFLARLSPVRDGVLDGGRVGAGDTVLDVGCGDGLIAFGALERGATRVIFSDVSQDLLDVSREHAGGDPAPSSCSRPRRISRRSETGRWTCSRPAR